ncbi:chaplin [Streptomyces roseifaciens]|uniref:chaplin n=1 Tax=Streptomyces roseifaciens TaxID=1488406 RepID=UPI0007181DD7|nr:chaplin [Streptomyces roseifaciens]
MTPTTKAAGAAAAATLLAAAGAGAATADSVAVGTAHKSPGVISGNVIQIPIHVPINLCSLTLDVVGLLNPASGNVCISD